LSLAPAFRFVPAGILLDFLTFSNHVFYKNFFSLALFTVVNKKILNHVLTQHALTVSATTLAIAFTAGFLAKTSDSNQFPTRTKIIFGLTTGLLFALAASLTEETKILFYGIAIGVLIAGKIDAPAHYAALASGLAGILTFKTFNFPPDLQPTHNNLFLITIVALTTFLDEKTHDLTTNPPKNEQKREEKRKEKREGKRFFGEGKRFFGFGFNGINFLLKLFKFVARNRLFLEIFAVAFALLANAFLFLAALLAFDVGYAIATRFQKICFQNKG